MKRYEQHPLYGVCLEDVLEWVPRISIQEPVAEPQTAQESKTALLVRELLAEIGQRRER